MATTKRKRARPAKAKPVEVTAPEVDAALDEMVVDEPAVEPTTPDLAAPLSAEEQAIFSQVASQSNSEPSKIIAESAPDMVADAWSKPFNFMQDRAELIAPPVYDDEARFQERHPRYGLGDLQLFWSAEIPNEKVSTAEFVTADMVASSPAEADAKSIMYMPCRYEVDSSNLIYRDIGGKRLYYFSANSKQTLAYQLGSNSAAITQLESLQNEGYEGEDGLIVGHNQDAFQERFHREGTQFGQHQVDMQVKAREVDNMSKQEQSGTPYRELR